MGRLAHFSYISGHKHARELGDKLNSISLSEECKDPPQDSVLDLRFRLSKDMIMPHKTVAWSIYLLVIWSGLAFSHPYSRIEPNYPRVDLGYAKYRGVRLPGGVDQFLGMRYAQAPTGGLRFKAPREPGFHYEEQDASQVRFRPRKAVPKDFEASSESLTPLIVRCSLSRYGTAAW